MRIDPEVVFSLLYQFLLVIRSVAGRLDLHRDHGLGPLRGSAAHDLGLANLFGASSCFGRTRLGDQDVVRIEIFDCAGSCEFVAFLTKLDGTNDLCP